MSGSWDRVEAAVRRANESMEAGEAAQEAPDDEVDLSNVSDIVRQARGRR